jgi:hypothetical protein
MVIDKEERIRVMEIEGKKLSKPILVRFSDMGRRLCRKEAEYKVSFCFRRVNLKIKDIRIRRPIVMRKEIEAFNNSYTRNNIDPRFPYREKNQDFRFGRKILGKCW